MPIYEYRCEQCGHEDEHLQKLSEAALTVCPACGKPAYKKQLSAAGFQLKGSGWYATDFKGSGRKSEAKTDTKVDAKPDSSTDSKPDAKPESKPDAKPESKPKAAAAVTN